MGNSVLSFDDDTLEVTRQTMPELDDEVIVRDPRIAPPRYGSEPSAPRTSHRREYITLAILLAINLLNYIDRYTVTSAFYIQFVVRNITMQACSPISRLTSSRTSTTKMPLLLMCDGVRLRKTEESAFADSFHRYLPDICAPVRLLGRQV